MKYPDPASALSDFARLFRWALHNHNFDRLKHVRASRIAERVAVELDASSLGPRADTLAVSLPKTRVFSTDRSWAFLAPPRNLDNWLPILGFNYDLSDSHEDHEFRIRLAIFTIEGEELKGFGYRFEAPEAQPRASTKADTKDAVWEPSGHGFHHAQPTHKMQGLARAIPGVPPQFPDKDPTLALEASNPAQLLACALLSIYGADVLERAAAAEQLLLPVLGDLEAYKERVGARKRHSDRRRLRV